MRESLLELRQGMPAHGSLRGRAKATRNDGDGDGTSVKPQVAGELKITQNDDDKLVDSLGESARRIDKMKRLKEGGIDAYAGQPGLQEILGCFFW